MCSLYYRLCQAGNIVFTVSKKTIVLGLVGGVKECALPECESFYSTFLWSNSSYMILASVAYIFHMGSELLHEGGFTDCTSVGSFPTNKKKKLNLLT